MSKKKKARNSRKNILEFEIKNSQEVESLVLEKTDTIGEETIFEEKNIVQEAEIEKKGTASDDVNKEVDEILGTGDEQVDKVIEKPLTEKQRNRKIDTYIEFILIFILGVLIGIALKTEAGKRITIGFDDYQMKIVRQDYDINKIQFEVTKKSVEESKAQAEEEPTTEEVTSQVEE